MRFGLRELIFLLLLLSMPVAAYIFVFYPWNLTMSVAIAENRKKELKLAQLEDATHIMTDVGEEIDRLQEAIKVFEQKLPTRREEEVIIREVWELAVAHDLKVKRIVPDKILRKAQYAERPIKLVIVGDFDGFYSFLLELEKLPRLTRIPVMSLEKLTRLGEGQMQADIVLSIFFEGHTASGAARSREAHL